LNLVGTGLAGGFPMAPPIDFAFTDVRDVADVHLKLYQSPAAQGRYLASGPVLSVPQLLAAITQQRPAVTIPKTMPVWFARLFPMIDALQHAVTRKPRQMRSGFVAEYVGRHHALCTDKLQREIGWSPRPFEQTLRDTIGWFEGQRPEIV
jgi:dihydroflavonol-4-reductase